MLAKDFDIDNVKMSSIRSLDNGGKMIFLNYGEGIAPVYLQTPELDLPFPAFDMSVRTSTTTSVLVFSSNKVTMRAIP